MRLGIDYRPVTAAPNSGIGRQVLALEHAVRRFAGTDVRLYTDAPADHAHRQSASCPPWATPAHRLHRLLPRLRFEAGFLPRAIEHDGLDVYVATANMGLPLRRPRRTHLVQVVHDSFQITLRSRHASKLSERIYGVTNRLSIAHAVKVADSIWVPSHSSADALAELFPAARSRIHRLPNAVPFDAWQAGDVAVPVDLPERYWLAVGTSEPRKNIAWFVEAWREARRDGDVPALALVGQAAHLPAELAALPDLHFLSGVSDAQMAAIYRRAERLWHPSYAEGFGLPVVEAAACGTPVATARGSSLDEVTPPGAPRFGPHDSAALVTLMQATAGGAQRRPGESVTELQQWARGYDLPRYEERLGALLAGVAS